MFLTSLTLALILSTVPPAPSTPAAPSKALLSPSAQPAAESLKEVRAKFEKLYEAKDKAGTVALWKANPSVVLPVIDRDLEGSLKIMETDKLPDPAKIANMQQRAIFGAECAAEATGHPILVDYASSFVGWNESQKRQFRDGQAVYKKASELLQKGDGQAALASARETIERASLLGDWWGTAMGYDAQGSALQILAQLDDALNAYSHARIINHDLGLLGDELSNLQAMVDVCYAQSYARRGLSTAVQGIALARALGNDQAVKQLTEKQKNFEDKLASAPKAK